jgi:hypothetical protein
VRITLRVDVDVARFFRKLGKGVYQQKMNLVLRTFMLARLTEILGSEPPYEFMEQDELGKMLTKHEVDMMREVEKLRRRRLGFLKKG